MLVFLTFMPIRALIGSIAGTIGFSALAFRDVSSPAGSDG
jgi:hypothetical protein